VTGGTAGKQHTTGRGTAEDRLLARLAGLSDRALERILTSVRQVGELDRAVYEAIATVPTPALDGPARRLSQAANRSQLWLAIAAVLAVTGGPAGRRAALRGTVAIGVTSAVVNLAIKPAWARKRPDRAGAGVPGRRQVRMPESGSFPSGHSASAFAFATAIGGEAPWLSLLLHFLATAVAYSRVHTGVHYPGDTVIGAVIGSAAGQAVAGSLGRAAAR
jgi:undecaprenyl-diphosphatase